MVNIEVLNKYEEMSAIINLFSTGLGDTNKEHWIWKHFTPNSFEPSVFLVAKDDNEIIGMMVFMPCQYKKEQEIINVVQMCDLVVHPKYRGRGIFTELYNYGEKYFAERGFKYFIAFPNENSYHGFVKFGFKDAFKIQSYIHIPDYLRFISSNFGCKSIVNNKSNNFVKRLYEINEYILEIHDECPFEKYDIHSNSFISFSNCSLNKTNDFFKWKFDERPSMTFQYVTVTKNDILLAYFVFTLTFGNKITAINIVDWDVDNGFLNGNFSNIVKKVFKIMGTRGDIIELWGSYDEGISKLLRKKMGFISIQSIPFINRKCRKTPFAIKSLQDNDYSCVCDKNYWFINKLDTDL